MVISRDLNVKKSDELALVGIESWVFCQFSIDDSKVFDGNVSFGERFYIIFQGHFGDVVFDEIKTVVFDEGGVDFIFLGLHSLDDVLNLIFHSDVLALGAIGQRAAFLMKGIKSS